MNSVTVIMNFRPASLAFPCMELLRFAKESPTPTRWTSVVKGDQLVMDIQMAGLAEDRTDYFARVLGRMPMVNVVLTSTKSLLPVKAAVAA